MKRTAKHADVQEEFKEVLRLRRVRKKPRKRLLQVLHSTRALDTTLGEFLRLNSVKLKSPTLGSYLYAFRDNSFGGRKPISELERVQYQKKIVKLRNKYMHEAGEMPENDLEVMTLLAEMQSCLARVL